MSFRWGVLGAGPVARKFVLDLREIDASATVVASRTPERAQRFAAELNVQSAARSYEDAISYDVDAFYIATPPSEHASLALQCIAAGKPVLIEKPFAMNADQALEVISAARRASVFCMEAMWTRFLPLIQRLKSAVDQGAVGEVRLISGSFGNVTASEKSPNIYSKELGGGALLHRGIYPLSLASYILGAPTSVASKALIGASGVDEDTSVTASHANGGVSVSYSSLRVQAPNDLTIMGTTGLIEVGAPLYRPFQMKIRPARSSGDGGGRFEALKEGGFMQGANQRLVGISKTIRGGKAKHVRAFYRGNGYSYEAEEVMRCVARGHLESDVMPLAETLALAGAMDAARGQWA